LKLEIKYGKGDIRVSPVMHQKLVVNQKEVTIKTRMHRKMVQALRGYQDAG
jgi:hypothetical protein